MMPVSYTHLDVYKRQEIHGDVGAGFPVGFHGGELGGLHFRDDLRVMVALKAEQLDEDQGEGLSLIHIYTRA